MKISIVLSFLTVITVVVSVWAQEHSDTLTQGECPLHTHFKSVYYHIGISLHASQHSDPPDCEEDEMKQIGQAFDMKANEIDMSKALGVVELNAHLCLDKESIEHGEVSDDDGASQSNRNRRRKLSSSETAETSSTGLRKFFHFFFFRGGGKCYFCHPDNKDDGRRRTLEFEKLMAMYSRKQLHQQQQSTGVHPQRGRLRSKRLLTTGTTPEPLFYHAADQDQHNLDLQRGTLQHHDRRLSSGPSGLSPPPRTPQPTRHPTPRPTLRPTRHPTPRPTPYPSPRHPTPRPTARPSPKPAASGDDESSPGPSDLSRGGPNLPSYYLPQQPSTSYYYYPPQQPSTSYYPPQQPSTRAITDMSPAPSDQTRPTTPRPTRRPTAKPSTKETGDDDESSPGPSELSRGGPNLPSYPTQQPPTRMSPAPSDETRPTKRPTSRPTTRPTARPTATSSPSISKSPSESHQHHGVPDTPFTRDFIGTLPPEYVDVSGNAYFQEKIPYIEYLLQLSLQDLLVNDYATNSSSCLYGKHFNESWSNGIQVEVHLKVVAPPEFSSFVYTPPQCTAETPA